MTVTRHGSRHKHETNNDQTLTPFIKTTRPGRHIGDIAAKAGRQPKADGRQCTIVAPYPHTA